MEFDRILIDGNYWARKFFSVHKGLLANIDGKVVRTGLTHGFLLGLTNLKEKHNGVIIVCWDDGNDRRKNIDRDYKSERRERNKNWDEAKLYSEHLKVLRFFLKLLGIRQAKKRGEEGDDVIFTLAKRCEGRALIVSNDHDMYQALGDGVYQWVSKKRGDILYSASRLSRDMGLSPKQYSQVMAIAGCSGDGVKGVPGVGIKIASNWVIKWPQLVPALLGQDDTPLTDWLPKVDSKNFVEEGTQFFPEGERGPNKKLKLTIKEPWTVYKTEQLTRLYDVWPVQFFRGKYDEEKFVLQLERAELHECETRLDTLRKLHK